jgi:transposase
LVVTPEGLPLAYEVLPGNTSDKTTLRGFLERIERQYGKARRVWLMDRGVPRRCWPRCARPTRRSFSW